MTDNANDGKWQSETDFTENILKYLKLNFRSNDTGGSSPGKYVSHWTWNAVDSLQKKRPMTLKFFSHQAFLSLNV